MSALSLEEHQLVVDIFPYHHIVLHKVPCYLYSVVYSFVVQSVSSVQTEQLKTVQPSPPGKTVVKQQRIYQAVSESLDTDITLPSVAQSGIIQTNLTN